MTEVTAPQTPPSRSIWAHHWQVLKDSWALETERLKTRKRWRETDFLPAALEVIETPPNPLGRLILWVLIAFVTLALIWSVFAKLDVVASAPGKVVAAGRNKMVQAADGGVAGVVHLADHRKLIPGRVLHAHGDMRNGAAILRAKGR